MNNEKMNNDQKIAVIGSGISGLAISYLLKANGFRVKLFEKNDYFGGHSNTVEISCEGVTFPVDTGFLVHNKKTYPNLIQFLDLLKVKTVESDMSLSIQLKDQDLEWAGNNLGTIYPSLKNLLSFDFNKMIFEIFHFNKNSPEYLKECEEKPNLTLEQFLNEKGYSDKLRDWYLLPMTAAIWSSPPREVLKFPAITFFRFCLNHCLLQISDRPIWRTILGGARKYVEKIVDYISDAELNIDITSIDKVDKRYRLNFNNKSEFYDVIVLASPANKSVDLIRNLNLPSEKVLRRFKFQKNVAVLHKDIHLLPKNQKLWSSWNYTSTEEDSQVSVTYFLNKLQPLPVKTPIMVTLNPHQKIKEEDIFKVIDYAHPLYDLDMINAQKELESYQGSEGIFYCGAWLGYGFHEDGLKSALRVARNMGLKIPWEAFYE